MVGGCETKVEICGDRWVDWFDGFDLVLVSYGLMGFEFFFSYGFDQFNLKLVASVLVLASLF